MKLLRIFSTYTRCLIVIFGLSLISVASFADEESKPDQISTTYKTPKTLNASFSKVNFHTGNISQSVPVGCPQTSVSLTDSDFGDGAYYLQAGFAEGESLAATYQVPADQFPIKIDVMDVLFGTSNAIVETTTHWSVTVWDGTPDEGIQVASYSSDDVILPHLVMPPGSNGIIISVSVDPGDPDQIYVNNVSGLNSFTLAFRIDQHNTPGNPCITAPPSNRNAFPCTDTSGLQFPNENLIYAVDGTLCVCGTGWMTFQELPGICTPSGDWVLRASYTPVNCSEDPIACCFSDTSCMDVTPSDCSIFGGTSADSGTTCDTYACGSGSGACCVESTGNCVDFDLQTCVVVGGIHMGEGTSCAQTTCFPEGACCLAAGSCISPVSSDDCLAVGGLFQGDATSCSTVSCPQPIGACCSATWCLDLTEDDCNAVAGDWYGAETTCENSSGCQTDCPEDIDGDGNINVSDLLSVVGDWGATDSDADVDNNGIVDTSDLLAIISAWGTCD